MTYFTDAPRLPVIDLSPFEIGNPWRGHVAAQIDWAASEFGLFRVVNHGIEPALGECLVALSRRWLAREPAVESLARPSLAGLRDFAEELGFPDVVGDYVSGMTGLAHRLMTSFARGLHLGDTYFVDRHTGDADFDFRVAEVTSGGRAAAPALLSLFEHDDSASLELRHRDRLLQVPRLPGALICAVGDSLERLTSGRYRVAAYRLVGQPARQSLALSFHFGARSPSIEHARAA